MATKVTHGEKSIIVPHIDFKTLHELGKKYKQDAVLFKDKSGTIGIYDKDGEATLAYDEDGDMSVSKSTDTDKEYSRGRGMSFGLNLVDRKFKYDGQAVTKDQVLQAVQQSKPKSDKAADPKEDKAKQPKDSGDFLQAMGNRKVPNPNPKSREQHPQVKIKSLEWEHQKKYYDQWANH